MEKSKTSRIKIQRTITWEGESTATTISIDDYLSLMKEFGKEKAKSVRSARRYLRSLGLILNRNGEIIGKK